MTISIIVSSCKYHAGRLELWMDIRPFCRELNWMGRKHFRALTSVAGYLLWDTWWLDNRVFIGVKTVISWEIDSDVVFVFQIKTTKTTILRFSFRISTEVSAKLTIHVNTIWTEDLLHQTVYQCPELLQCIGNKPAKADQTEHWSSARTNQILSLTVQNVFCCHTKVMGRISTLY